MRWIARFFLIVALVFLYLDVMHPLPDPAAAPAAPAEGTTEGGGATVPQTPAAVEESGRVILYPLGERWFSIHKDSYLQISPAISRHVSPWLDDSVVQPLLLQPAFLIVFVLWLVFSLLSWLIGRARYDDGW